MRSVLMTACTALVACLSSAPAVAQMMPWGNWESRPGNGSMFSAYGMPYSAGYAPYSVGYAPAYQYTAAYGASYYGEGCCGMASPCSSGTCGTPVGCCGSASPCGPGGCGYAAGYGDNGCGCGPSCGPSCCDVCAGGGCSGGNCSGGSCSNCVATPSTGGTLSPTPDNSRPAGPQPTLANPPRPGETDGFAPSNTPAGTGTFDGTNRDRDNFARPTTPGVDLGPGAGSSTIPRTPAAGEPGAGSSAPTYNPVNPGTAAPAFPGTNGTDLFERPAAPAGTDFSTPPAGDGIRLNKPDATSINFTDGPIAHRYDANRHRSQLFTATRSMTVSRVVVRDVAPTSEKIASNR